MCLVMPAVFEKFYAECHTRLEKTDRLQRGIAHKAEVFLKKCQIGDGHRRALLTADTGSLGEGGSSVSVSDEAASSSPEEKVMDGKYGEFSEFFEAPTDSTRENI